jgi:RNA polymerase sigma factor (sigma-70 family)
MSAETFPPLTPAQQTLVASALGVVDRALAAVRRRFREGITDDELLAIGQEALCEAAQRFDPKHGAPLEGYAWTAVHGAMWNALHKETQFQRAARSGGYKAADAQQEEGSRGGDGETSRAPPVQAFSDAVVAGMLVEVIAQSTRRRALGDADAVLEYAQAMKALQTALSDLSEQDRQLVDLHYYQDVPIYQAGAPLKMGRTVVKARHRGVLKRLAARLRTLGVTEAPPVRGETEEALPQL